MIVSFHKKIDRGGGKGGLARVSFILIFLGMSGIFLTLQGPLAPYT